MMQGACAFDGLWLYDLKRSMSEASNKVQPRSQKKDNRAGRNGARRKASQWWRSGAMTPGSRSRSAFAGTVFAREILPQARQ
jgi:hypothetical protein